MSENNQNIVHPPVGERLANMSYPTIALHKADGTVERTPLAPFELSQPQPFKRPRRTVKLSRRDKDELAASLGLVKVRGAVSGRVYYE
jgi:hypothetical protein